MPAFVARRDFVDAIKRSTATHVLDATGVHTRTLRGEEKNEWDVFRRAREDGHAFYLFFTRDPAIILPKRALPPEEIDQVRALFAKHLPGRRTRRTSMRRTANRSNTLLRA